MSDVVLALSIFPVFELAVAVLLAVEREMSPGFGQILFPMLLFGRSLMFHQWTPLLSGITHINFKLLSFYFLL